MSPSVEKSFVRKVMILITYMRMFSRTFLKYLFWHSVNVINQLLSIKRKHHITYYINPRNSSFKIAVKELLESSSELSAVLGKPDH